jgi:hypothetical protein
MAVGCVAKVDDGGDTDGGVSSDGGDNHSPVVEVGPAQTLQLPVSSFTLTGSASDPDGDALTYAWTTTSGGGVTIVSPDALSSEVTGLEAGRYTFTLTVDDGHGGVATASADVQVVAIPTADYYVALDGDDSNPGTIDQPFATWEKLGSVLQPGDTVFIRGGTYHSGKPATTQAQVYLHDLHGTAAEPIQIFAYPGERPVLDFGDVIKASNTNHDNCLGFFMERLSYVHFKGFRVTNVPQNVTGNVTINVFLSSSDHVTFENIESDHGMTGFRIDNSDDVTYLNCDAHHHQNPYDPNNYPYGGADGFTRTGASNTSTRVVYRGCRAWWNSDDGWDMFNTNGTVTIQDSWSFWNGYIPGTFDIGGDGNGFKLAGGQTSVGGVTRFLDHDLAFANRANGFDQNAGNFTGQLYNDTSYGNGGIGFSFGYFAPTLAHLMKNNVSYGDAISGASGGGGWVQSNNTWNGGVTVSDADFAGISSVGVDGPRAADGGLPVLDFLRLVTGSDLVDAGVDVGLPFDGLAPDIGACEL